MKTRGESLIRVLRLLRLLESGERFTLLALADRLNVTTRTIRRDFDALAAAGYDVSRCGWLYADGTMRHFGNRGVWKLRRPA